MTIPFNFTQPSLVLNQSIVIRGNYPGWEGYADGTALGMIVTTGFFNDGTDLTNSLIPAQGQILNINGNSALYSLLGINYGGNGQSNFVLPSLGSASILGATSPSWIGAWQNSGAAVYLGEVNGSVYPVVLNDDQLPASLGGSSLPINNQDFSQSLQYLIQAQGTFPMPGKGVPAGTVGVIVPYAGTNVPGGFVACNGQTLNIADFPFLFKVLGTTYGGDGINTFAVPNLTDHVPIGTGGQYELGQTTGSASVTLTPVLDAQGNSANIFQTISNFQPSLAVHHIINTEGLFGAILPGATTLGQIMMFAGETIPDGWTLCEGQILSIEDNQALFSLIGTAFGGDGETNFALPDLRDRTIVGSGGPYGDYGPLGVTIGDVLGQYQTTLTALNLPPIVVPPPGLSLDDDTGSSDDDQITNISQINVSGVWPNADIEYSLDGKTWSSTIQAMEGKNTIYVRQVDYIGQSSASSQALNFILDTIAPSAPQISLQKGKTANAVSGSATGIPQSTFGALALDGVEEGATLFYSVDSGITWSKSFTAKPGLNHVQVKQIDKAGNSSDQSPVFSFEYLASEGQNAQTSISVLPDGGRRIDVLKPGQLTDTLGTSSKDVIYFDLQSSIHLPLTVEDIVLSGLGSGNAVAGHSGSNSFAIETGSWIIDGGFGHDRLIISGSIEDFTLRSSIENGEKVTLLFGKNGQVIFKNIESIEFDNATLSATGDKSSLDLFALYKSVLDRSPDLNGFKVWKEGLDNGLSLANVANAFLSSQEALIRNGAAQTNQDFITDLYLNALGRNPDPLGFKAWTSALDSKQLSRSDIVIGIIGSDEAKALNPETYFVAV